MKKNLSALALFLTLSAYCSPCSSLADDVAPDNAGKGGSVPESGRAALLEEAKSRLLSRGGKLLNSARGEFLRLVGLDGAVPGTLAEVNGQPISLRQVEALYDMRTAGSENAQAISLDELRAEYASCLQTLVAQILVHEELLRRGLTVSEAERIQEERRVSMEYGVEPGPEFDALIRDEGIEPALWREQLQAFLELELWQNVLAASISPSPEDVSAFVRKHPELAEEPARYVYLSVSGPKKSVVDAARSGGKTDPETLGKQGLTVQRLEDVATDLPPSFVAALDEIKPGQSLPVQAGGEQWGYTILLEKEDAHPKSALELFAYAQEALRRERLPALYDVWLEKAVEGSHIRMGSQLQPRNVPRPAPRPVPEFERKDDREDEREDEEGNALLGQDA